MTFQRMNNPWVDTCHYNLCIIIGRTSDCTLPHKFIKINIIGHDFKTMTAKLQLAHLVLHSH